MSNSNLPSQYALFWPLLHVAEDDAWHDNNQVFKWVFDYLKIPEAVRKLRYEKSGDLIMINHGQFALNTLRTAGLIERQTGKYRLSTSGRHLINEYDWKTADYRVITHLPAYKKVRKKSEKKRRENQHKDKLIKLQSENEDFQSQIDDFVSRYNSNVKQQLLAKLQALDKPTDLESIMVRLLEAMGYRGENGSSLVTPQSNDGGIDCIINQDPLGLSKVLVQVKRYASDNIVDRPKIQAFYGALHTTYHMDRGIFITTSDFTQSAIEIARQNNIILINGDKLADLMIEYGVMTKVKKMVKLYELE